MPPPATRVPKVRPTLPQRRLTTKFRSRRESVAPARPSVRQVRVRGARIQTNLPPITVIASDEVKVSGTVFDLAFRLPSQSSDVGGSTDHDHRSPFDKEPARSETRRATNQFRRDTDSHRR